MSTIELDKTTPLPTPRQRMHTVYPWNSMEPGHSFFVTITEVDNLTMIQRRVLASARAWSMRRGGKFTTRRVIEDGVAGVRCWRTE